MHQACLFNQELVIDAKMPYLFKTGQAGNPLFVFLHGAGEKGCQAADLQHNTCDSSLTKYKPNWHLLQCCCPTGVASWPRDIVHACIQKIVQQHKIQSVILAGISMGARGVFELAYTYNEYYAAYISVAGFGIPNLASNLNNTPVWLAHGEHDRTVPIKRARDMHAALSHAHLQSYQKLGHNCLEESLNDPALWEWLDNNLNK